MRKKLMNVFHVLICAVLIFQLTGCGTLLYPERKGQKAGRIDMGVALLDGLGLLLFLVPGVIAFAVDFNNGTIYLPGTSRSSLDLNDVKQVKFDPKKSNVSDIENIITKETGCEVKLYRKNLKVSKLKSVDDMMAQFANILPGMRDDRIVFAH